MQLSVIICTYNREKYLPGLLESIANNTLVYSQYELIVVDNNSTDSTAELYKAFAANHPKFNARYVLETEQGLSHARNRGIQEAQGEVVVYVDDDATIPPQYLATYYNFFAQHPECMAAGGPILPHYETAEPQWMSHYTRQLLTAYLYKGKQAKLFKRNEFPGGGNAAYRKCVFDTTGLFNTQLGRKGNALGSAEEKDIFDKMRSKKMKIFYLPDAILYHIIPQHKLEEPYFNQLTYLIGKSERERTLAISPRKYLTRLLSEAIKWGATLVLATIFTLKLSPKKGWKLIQFRHNVTRGLINKPALK